MKNRYARPDNFAHHIRTPLLRKHFVYRAFDADGRLLYVGCTSSLDARLKEHRSQADWRNDVARMKVCGPYNYETARFIEWRAIETERAMHNHSTERRELKRLHHALIRQEMERREKTMTWEDALTEAIAYADAALPEGLSRRAVVITDELMARARELVRRGQERVA